MCQAFSALLTLIGMQGHLSRATHRLDVMQAQFLSISLSVSPLLPLRHRRPSQEEVGVTHTRLALIEGGMRRQENVASETQVTTKCLSCFIRTFQ